ncbi:hypothetical protein [Armatimonas rosea]|uniref:Ankyrin repeat protein n=1 Tax=Armatimonas rosea TaxID=685828 RepID=A0A7W9W7F6_ARMRO|nr:hypothetical protein [Armatimonas rosea]MBB6052414.1 hypothetical protein [Armatimonas rosea]
MGSTFHNFHVRTTEVAWVRGAIEATASIAWVSAEPQNGWVSVYPYRCEARVIAEQTRLPVLYLSEYDGDIAQYELFENGLLVDTFDSAPDYWVGSDSGSDDPIRYKTLEELAALAGNPDALLPYCLPGTRREDIVTALGKTKRDCWIATGEATGKPFDEEAFLAGQKKREPRLAYLFQRVAELEAEFATPIPPSPVPPKPYLDQLDSTLILGELEGLLGLNGRLLYSGTERQVWEEGFSLEFIGENLLTQAEKNNFLHQSIPNMCVVPHLGRPLERHLDAKLAAMRLWLSLGASPNEDDARGDPFSIPLLMEAVRGNCPEAVEILLDAGASPHVSYTTKVYQKGYVTLTPVALAEQVERKDEILALLARFGA